MQCATEWRLGRHDRALLVDECSDVGERRSTVLVAASSTLLSVIARERGLSRDHSISGREFTRCELLEQATRGEYDSSRTSASRAERWSDVAGTCLPWCLPSDKKVLICRIVRIPYAPSEESPANRGVVVLFRSIHTALTSMHKTADWRRIGACAAG